MAYFLLPKGLLIAIFSRLFSLFFFPMFAVVLTGAKQYLVREGDVIRVEKLETPVGKTHTFEKVLLISKDDKEVDVGMPFLKSTVEGKVVDQGKGDKIRVFKMKAKNKLWPQVSGTSMNAVDHPFGASRVSKGGPTQSPRSAPPGRKVVKIAPRRTGKLR